MRWSGIVVISAAAALFGREVSFSIQWPLYEALRTTAAIVFGVVGVWIAIVYPATLKRLLNRTTETAQPEDEELTKLLLPMLYSGLIVAVVLVVGPAAAIARHQPALQAHATLLRGLSFSMLVLLTCAQLWSLLLTLVGPDFALRDLRALRERTDILARARRLVGRGKRRSAGR